MNYSAKAKLFTALAAGAAVISLLSLMGFFGLYITRTSISASQNAKIRSTQEQITKAASDLPELQKIQQEFERLDNTNKRLISLLSNESAAVENQNLTVKRLKDTNAELLHSKSTLNELHLKQTSLSTQLTQLTAQIEGLIDRNNSYMASLTSLHKDNRESELQHEHYLNKHGIGHAFRIEATHDKRLTATARRVRQIKISFDIGQLDNLTPLVNEVYYIVLTNHLGQIISSGQQQSRSIRLIGNPVELLPSFAVRGAQDMGNPKRVLLAIDRVSLRSGLYHFDIFSSDNFIGSTQIRLN